MVRIRKLPFGPSPCFLGTVDAKHEATQTAKPTITTTRTLTATKPNTRERNLIHSPNKQKNKQTHRSRCEPSLGTPGNPDIAGRPRIVVGGAGKCLVLDTSESARRRDVPKMRPDASPVKQTQTWLQEIDPQEVKVLLLPVEKQTMKHTEVYGPFRRTWGT